MGERARRNPHCHAWCSSQLAASAAPADPGLAAMLLGQGTEISFPLLCKQFPCEMKQKNNSVITVTNTAELRAHRQAGIWI